MADPWNAPPSEPISQAKEPTTKYYFPKNREKLHRVGVCRGFMTATSAVPIDNLVPIHPIARDSTDDPLADETVLKTGWLSKKGRRGVDSLIICG